MIPPEERWHLDHGSRENSRPGGAGAIDVVVVCADPVDQVLERTREVLGIVIDHQVGAWPTSEEWRALLPSWFVSACAAEMTPQQAEMWLEWWQRLSPEEQQETAEQATWSLDDWLYWFEPGERQWFWWDAEIEPPDRVRIRLEVPGWPTTLGAFEWLLRASGASTITIDEPSST